MSCACLFLFFLLPKNREWFNDRVIVYFNDFRTQRYQLNLEQRKVKRWGSSYTVSMEIAGLVLKNGDLKKAIVLIPPTEYFKKRNVDYPVPEPAVFYYYTGLKSVYINSENILEANWLVTANQGHVIVIAIKDKKGLSDSISNIKND